MKISRINKNERFAFWTDKPMRPVWKKRPAPQADIDVAQALLPVEGLKGVLRLQKIEVLN
jgi:hypothetical protein